jgi:putative membrane protein insertion efficiency factor
VSAVADGVSRETPSGGDGLPERRRAAGGRLTWLALAPIRGYRRFISPLLGPRCRYYPTCSAYAEQAVRELGPLRGTIVAVWRVLRCNPLSPGGLDPLEDRRLFRRNRHPAGPTSPEARAR